MDARRLLPGTFLLAVLLAPPVPAQLLDTNRRAREALEEGDRLLRAGYAVLAIRQYRDAGKAGAPSVAVELRIAHAQCAAGNYAAADEVVGRVLTLHGRNREALLLRARVRFWQRRYEASWPWFRRYLEHARGDDAARMDYALSLAWGRRFDDAVVELRKLEKSRRFGLEARFRHAEVLAWKKQYAGARHVLDRLLARRELPVPLRARCHVLEGRMLAWQKKFAPAEARYHQAIRVHPRSEAAWMAMGEVLEWQGKTEEAKAAYARALQAAPSSQAARKALARMQRR